MKFLGKFFLTLLLLLLFTLVVIYVLLQTHWGAGWFSRWVSDKTEWHLSLSKIEHNFSSPSHIILDDFSFGHDGQPAVLVARRVDLGLALIQFSDPLHFSSLELRDGEVNLANLTQGSALPIQADRLQLNNMRVDSPNTALPLLARQVNGGIMPWKPVALDMLGRDARFQMSAGSMTLNEVPAENVLNQLRLNDIRLQTASSLKDFLHKLQVVPSLAITRLDLTDARLQGPDWAVTDLDLTLRNVNWQNDDWQSNDGSLALNASNFINGGFELNDPIINLDFSPQGVALTQFSSRWANGVIRADGEWSRSDKRLTLKNLAVAGLEYTLPQDWRDRWQATLPAWLESVEVTRFTSNRNLIIDINPAFPFQLTSLDGTGENLRLAQQHQWGIWSGKLSLNAAESTFNRTDLRHPSITLSADAQQIQVTELSAFSNKGLLEGTATLGQQPARPLTLQLTGRAVPVNVLQNWGWPALPLSGDSNMQLQLRAALAAGQPLRPSVNGTLSVVTDSQQVQQTMQAGEVR